MFHIQEVIHYGIYPTEVQKEDPLEGTETSWIIHNNFIHLKIDNIVIHVSIVYHFVFV